MAFVIADRVRETTTTTGTGTITLAGAVTNFETFTANLSNSDTTYYAIVDNTNGAFEVGLGTFTSSGTTLARSVIASSNSNNLVDFGAGTKDVFITVPASKIVVEDGSNNVAIGGTVTATAFSGSGASLTGVDVVNDTSPQLGGALDVQTHDIVTTSNRDLELAPNGTGKVVVKGNDNQGAIKLNCEANSHGQTIIAAPHSESANNTLTLPSTGGDARLVSTSSTATLTNKTLTAPVLSGSSSAAGSILFKEDTDNGTNAVTLIGPASTTDVTITLPSSAGTVALTSDIPSGGISSGNVATFTSGVADNDFLRIDGTAVEGRSASEVLSDIGGQASLTFGISDTNAVKIDSSSVADDEFARFTASGLESRSASEVRSDIGLGTAATLAVGISNTNVAQFGSGVVDDDFLRVNGTTIEGRSASEVADDIGAATKGFATAMAIAL
jgi:hypothetical protein